MNKVTLTALLVIVLMAGRHAHASPPASDICRPDDTCRQPESQCRSCHNDGHCCGNASCGLSTGAGHAGQSRLVCCWPKGSVAFNVNACCAPEKSVKLGAGVWACGSIDLVAAY